MATSDYDWKTTEFAFKGFKDLYKAIDHLPEVVKKIELEPLLVRSLEPMAEYARVMAPDDPATPPPYDLKTSIAVGTRQRTGRAKTDRALGRFDARAKETSWQLWVSEHRRALMAGAAAVALGWFAARAR